LHEAVQKITETLALHFPPPTPIIDSSKQKSAEPPTTAPELVSVAPAAPAAPAPELSKSDTPEVPAVAAVEPTSPPKRPTLEKRSSVLGSLGKILWPFGSAAQVQTGIEGIEVPAAGSNAPKVPTVLVTEVPPTPEIEI